MSERVRALVLRTEEAWAWHKQRGRLGQIEAAAARIRHVALRDCWRIVDPDAEQMHVAPWQKQ